MIEKEIIPRKTIRKLSQLSDDELKEAHDFVDFLTSRLDDHNLTSSIQEQAQEGHTFHFLQDEEELYTKVDLQGIPIL
jgi:hypothetical protein